MRSARRSRLCSRSLSYNTWVVGRLLLHSQSCADKPVNCHYPGLVISKIRQRPRFYQVNRTFFGTHRLLFQSSRLILQMQRDSPREVAVRLHWSYAPPDMEQVRRHSIGHATVVEVRLHFVLTTRDAHLSVILILLRRVRSPCFASEPCCIEESHGRLPVPQTFITRLLRVHAHEAFQNITDHTRKLPSVVSRPDAKGFCCVHCLIYISVSGQEHEQRSKHCGALARLGLGEALQSWTAQ